MKSSNKLFKPFFMIYAKLFPVKYAKYLGVNSGENLHIYGSSYKMFGTEPWCVTLGESVYLTDEVRFITHDGATLIFRNKIPDLEITQPIIVGDNVYFGVNTIVLPGVIIGSNCIIGAGSVVTKDIPDNSVFAGVPAKYIKSTDEYLEQAQKKSLHIGHLTGKTKDDALKKIFNYDQ